MSLQQKSATYNRALALLDYHNHHPLVPKPVTQLLCSLCFQMQYRCSAGVGGEWGVWGNLIITCWYYQFKHLYLSK